MVHGNLKHGMSWTPTHKTWMSMRQRCNNPKAPNYHLYGGKGIKICGRWNSFLNFLIDMGERPSIDYSINRKDSTKDYGPDNCEWITKAENSRQSGLGRTMSEEHKQIISDTWKGRKRGPPSEEHKEKIRQANKGKKKPPFTDEHRANMSKAAKLREAQKRI